MSTIQASLFDGMAIQVPSMIGGTFVRPVEAGSILTPTKGRLAAYDYSLNPYRGCGFGCSYCYAAFFVPDDVRRDAWGKWVEVKANAVRLLERARNLGGARIYMSSVTDPYQPLESATELTRAILEHLADRRDQPSLVIQTRGPLVTRDIDLLRKIKRLRVNMSITTDSDVIRKRFEPACASIGRRFEALAELRDAGIRTAVCVAPMLPIEDVIGFARRLKEAAADHYAASYFHSSDKLFASGTGARALELAREYDWTTARFRRAKAVLESLVPRFGGAWDPA